MLNRSGDSGHPCLVPDFRVNGFSFSPLSIEKERFFKIYFSSTKLLSPLQQGIIYSQWLMQFLKHCYSKYHYRENGRMNETVLTGNE
jgi:hypothetical protein